MMFTLLERKDCKNYRKNIYRSSIAIDEQFVSLFSCFGSCFYYDFSKYSEKSLIYFRVRCDVLDLQIEGSIDSTDLVVTFPKGKENEAVDLFEFELGEWINNARIKK